MVSKREASYIFEKMEYRPTKKEWQIHEDGARIKQVVGGERAGKSLTSATELLKNVIRDRVEIEGGKIEYWLVGHSYETCRGEWEHLIEKGRKLGVLVQASNRIDPGQIDLTLEVKIITKSAQDPQKLAMTAPSGILVCEAAQLPYEIFLKLRGRIAEKRGWMVLSGTLEGSFGWYAEKYNEWQINGNAEDAHSFSLPSWENTFIFPGGREDKEIKTLEATLPHDVFIERFGGLPCPPSMLIMKEFRNSLHVGDYSFDPECDVELWIDPGFAGAYAVEVVQVKNDIVYIVDEIYLQDYITEDIILITRKKPWISKVGAIVIDIAAKQHQAMPAPAEIWSKELNVPVRMNKVEVEAGIDRLRTFLMPDPVTKLPQLFVNFNCHGFIAECGGGKSPVPGGGAWLRDENTSQPLKKNNHALQAVIYGLVDRFGYSRAKPRIAPPINFLRLR